jgi:hypothetical protein
MQHSHWQAAKFIGRSFDGDRISVQPNHDAAGFDGMSQQPRVTAAAERTIDYRLPGRRAKPLDDLLAKYRDMLGRARWHRAKGKYQIFSRNDNRKSGGSC